ncbi:sodium/glutamate symporter [Fusibacter sp. 3D3]|uniref:sodium/glutamate symporter n=1 Tax=Fusibacter sp. 3D3 TaxID=1048380 RepID=UPI000852949E|nr:sodium/glutamate symporter [Fusibacter sp. 3D3]GAU77316.1 sodium/glutamate symport protein [Fusibacter sp. 3D3]
MIVKLTMIQMAALSVVVLFVGQFLKKKCHILEKYCIPSPVVGGVVFALLTLILKVSGILEFEMDTTLQSFFMITFFTTVGFTASLKMLKNGGKDVLLFLMLAVVLVIFQDLIGVGLAKIFNLNPLIGLSTGSVPMTGGHGTSGSFAPKFEELGAIGATTVAMASATFGLIAGSTIGGPIANSLINRYALHREHPNHNESSNVSISETPEVSSATFLSGASAILIAMGLGTILSMLLEKTGMTFPPYIGAMFAAAIIRNIVDASEKMTLKTFEIDIIGNVSLSLFLSMALMGLKLWQLADLALPLVVMLMAQVLFMAFFAYFITFNIMGRNYDAAVLAAGHCGFGMGATPNAIANMEVISAKYGFSYKAFFILPLVGSLFIDFVNAGVITFFVNLF